MQKATPSTQAIRVRGRQKESPSLERLAVSFGWRAKASDPRLSIVTVART
jgi:hypothetical protein